MSTQPEQGSCEWGAGWARAAAAQGEGLAGDPGVEEPGGWGCFPGLASLVLELGSGWPERLAGARAKVASRVLAGLGLTPDLSLTPEQ